MTRKTDPELLVRILDTYSSGVTNSLQTVAEMNGVSFRSVYTWLRDPEITVPEYMGMVDQSFGVLMQHARNVAKAITISRSLEDRVLNGLRVQIVHHGEFAYVDDEAAIRATKEEFEAGCEMGYFWPDKKKRDANGDRIVATKIEAPPAQLVEVYARANMPQIYGNKSEVTMKGQVNLGVTTIEGPRRPIPAEFAAYATKQDLEGITALLTDETEDAALAELLGPELDMTVTSTPPDDFDPDEISPMLEPLPAEVVIREQPAPAAYAPPPSPILAPPEYAPVEGWRAEYAALMAKQARNARPKTTDRG